MVTRERLEGCDIDSTIFQISNVASCEVVTGIQRTNLIRYYLPPANMDHLPDLKEALNHFLGKGTIVMGT